MSISEAQRFEMQVGLRSHLGDDVANTLMEHLPPSGWSDVVRKHDLDPINFHLAKIDENISRINGTLKIIIGSMITVSTAIIVLLIQLTITVSQL